MKEFTQEVASSRITVVDALRGFAIMAIMLLHNIEHFDYYYFPDYLPAWMKALDKHVWEIMFALFSGKAYAIFAVLFGFTFYIMDRKQQQLGKPFGGRFMWRMLLLLGFGVINSMFYSGDVLAIYAALGFTLVLVNCCSNKWVLAIAVFLLLQPVEIGRLIYIYVHPEYHPGDPLSWNYFGLSSAYLGGHSFFETAWGNLTNGRWACTLWSWEHGRFFQVPALFMLGLLLGRTKKFEVTQANTYFWKKTLLISVAVAVFFVLIGWMLPQAIENKVMIEAAKTMIDIWNNVALTLVWIALFWLLYQHTSAHRLLSRLDNFGKMSLTNYVMQSIMGCFVYNGCGLALYQYTGASLSLLLGIVLFIIQFQFCRWWLRNHRQGPLEALWHRLTWI